MRRILVLALMCLTADVLAQTPGAPIIAGRVVAAGTGVPLRRARVELIGQGVLPAGAPPELLRTSGAQPVLTDDDGRFAIEIQALRPAMPLTISKGGYVTTFAVIRRENANTPIELPLVRGAAISGIVLDLKGAPAAGYPVTIRRAGANPERDGSPAQFMSTTDDRGEYRAGGLPRGTYDVAAGSASTFLDPKASDPKLRERELGLGTRVQVRLDTGDELGGVQLMAPAITGGEALAIAMRDQAGVPPPGPRNFVPARGAAGAIRGRVLTAARTPVAGALVFVRGSNAGSNANLSARTDEKGAFEVLGLRAGRYMVEASVNGQMAWRHGQDRVGQDGRPIALATDQSVNADVILPAARALYGTVVDEHGEPVQGARIQAQQIQYEADRLVAAPVGAERRTDDRGSYRLWGLYDGTYLIQASVDGILTGTTGRQNTYATLYYPASPTVAGAQRIDLRDDTIANIVYAPVTLTQVTGLALDGDAQLVAGTARLIEPRQSGRISSARTASIRPDGTFTIRHVPTGNYILQILGDGPGRTGLFASTEVSVGESPVRVTLKASHGTSVEGRLVFEGADQLTTLNSFRVTPTPLDDRARSEPRVVVLSTTEFFVTGLFGPTTFSLRGSSTDDWYLKSFTINGTDITDTGFDFGAQPGAITNSLLVLSRNGASVSGRLRDSSSSNYFVVAFSTSRDARFALSRRVKFSRAAADGSFRIQGLPPGEYFVAAVDHLEGTANGGEWQNPELLARFETGAERVTLLEGQDRSVSLKLLER